MRIYNVRKVLFIGLIIIGVFSCKEPNKKTTEYDRPNVILIVVDDLGWKDLGFMGSEYYETPNLNAFAKQGMVFTQAYASAANCAPSRACMLSGKQSPHHGVYTVSPSDRGKKETRKIVPIKNTKYLTDNTYTLADMFKASGYMTGSFGKWHVGNDPTLQGIDVNVGGDGRGNPGKGGYFSPYKIKNITNGPDGEYLTDRLTDEAIQFVTDQKQNPFFLYLPFYTVHTPIMAKEELLQKFKDKPGSNGQSNPEYAAMVYSMDENVGRLLDHVKEQKLENNTVVIFTSDNGGIRAISSQEPLRAGKGSYYEGGTRVPLVIKWPNRILGGTTNTTRITNLDFYPTLQKIINASSVDFQFDGTDISPLFNGGELDDRDLVWHFPVYLQAYSKELDDGRDPLFRTRPGTTIISDNWKLHKYYEDESLELYNLSDDLGERNNLVDTNPEKTKELHLKMQKWIRDYNAAVPTEVNVDYDSVFEQSEIDKVE